MSTESDTTANTRTIKASEFKARCMELMDEVAETGQEIVITKNGNPIARLTPYGIQKETTAWERTESMYGKDSGKIQTLGDILAPMPPEWFAVPDEYADTDPLIAPITPDWSLSPDNSGEGGS